MGFWLLEPSALVQGGGSSTQTGLLAGAEPDSQETQRLEGKLGAPCSDPEILALQALHLDPLCGSLTTAQELLIKCLLPGTDHKQHRDGETQL